MATNGIKVYIASRYEDRDDCLDLKRILEAKDYEVVSRWLLPSDADQPMAKIKSDPALCEANAKKDEDDIYEAHAVVVCSPLKAHRTGTGGRHVECGIVMGMVRAGMQKGIVLYGEPENVFHFRQSVRKVAWDDIHGLDAAIKDSVAGLFCHDVKGR